MKRATKRKEWLPSHTAEMARLAGRGLTDGQIGQALGFSGKTVQIRRSLLGIDNCYRQRESARGKRAGSQIEEYEMSSKNDGAAVPSDDPEACDLTPAMAKVGVAILLGSGRLNTDYEKPLGALLVRQIFRAMRHRSCELRRPEPPRASRSCGPGS